MTFRTPHDVDTLLQVEDELDTIEVHLAEMFGEHKARVLVGTVRHDAMRHGCLLGSHREWLRSSIEAIERYQLLFGDVPPRLRVDLNGATYLTDRG
jgi:hypothetical protein